MSEFTARYGARTKWVDVTLKVLTRLYSDGAIVIPRGTALNRYFGDPIPRVVKELQITFPDGRQVKVGERQAKLKGARVLLPKREYDD